MSTNALRAGPGREQRRSLRVLITDGHALAALGAVRSLGRAGHRVFVAQSSTVAVAPAAWSRYRAGHGVHPDAYTRPDEFRAWLLAQARTGQYDAILPISEAAIVAATADADELSRHARLVMPPAEALRYTLSKYQATRLAVETGLPAPATVFVRGPGATPEARRQISGLTFPIVLKTDNHIGPDGRYVKGRTLKVATPDDVEPTLADLEAAPTSIIAQEHVGQRGVGAFLLRHDGQTVLQFAHRRLHEVPYTGGMSSLRTSTHDTAALGAAERLLAAMAYQGAAMVEFRQLADGSPCFLEVNGRLWGSLALALHAGVDFPRVWVESAVYGETDARQPAYPDGLICRDTIPGELLYVRSVVRARPQADEPAPPSKAGAVLEFARLSVDPRIRSDTLWRDDPLPWAAALADLGAQLGSKARRRAIRLCRRVTDRAILAAARHEHTRRLRDGAYQIAADRPVLFLCYGNICRSAFAERYWNQRLRERGLDGPLACSAGFHQREGRPSPSQCLLPARQLGVDLTEHRSRCVDRSAVDAAALIFIMDPANYRDVVRQFPHALGKLCWLGLFDPPGSPEIVDPYPLGAAEGLHIFSRIARAVDAAQELLLQQRRVAQPLGRPGPLYARST